MTKYKKGVSGNPAGKKPGTLNKRTRLAKLLEPHAENLINKTVELALDGDVNALRLCIERLIPKAVHQKIQIDAQNIGDENLSMIGKKVIAAISTGDIAPEDGRQLMIILDSQRKLIEHTDIMRKLEELEEYIPKL